MVYMRKAAGNAMPITAGWRWQAGKQLHDMLWEGGRQKRKRKMVCVWGDNPTACKGGQAPTTVVSPSKRFEGVPVPATARRKVSQKRFCLPCRQDKQETPAQGQLRRRNTAVPPHTRLSHHHHVQAWERKWWGHENSERGTHVTTQEKGGMR